MLHFFGFNKLPTSVFSFTRQSTSPRQPSCSLPGSEHCQFSLEKNFPSLVACDFLFAIWLCWSVMPPEQNSRPGQPMTSHRQRPSQTSHNKQLSIATLCLWSEEAEMRSVSLFLSSLLPFLSFSLRHLLISLFPLPLSRCIKWGDYSSSIGPYLKVQSVKRAFLSFPLIFYPFHRPIFFTLPFPFPLSFSIPFTPFNMFSRALECEIERAIPLIYLNSSTPRCLSRSVHLSLSLLSI